MTRRYDSADLERRVPEPPSRSGRTELQRDRARVLHSGALRRLAGKTQVVEPSGAGVGWAAAVPRTRLTHSLECAQIGRELGGALGADPDLVDAACLAHDIGHPPYGHNGERALDEVAGPCGGFEGNAQSLRVLTRLEVKVEGAGLNLTRAALDAATKYPWARTGEDGRPRAKYGAYDDDLEVLAWVRAGAEGQRRCFEAQVMDWADDVAYSVHDLEDGIAAGLVPLEALRDPDERAALCALAAGTYLEPDDGDRLGEVLSALLASPLWPDRHDGTARAQARLKALTSGFIGRFCRAAQEATTQRYGPGPLGRHDADLVVPWTTPDGCAPWSTPSRCSPTPRPSACTTSWSGAPPADPAAGPTLRRSGTSPQQPGARHTAAAPPRRAPGGAVAGRIRDDDVVLVRERAPIADVIGESVQLRPAGGGRLKGLCPFHDEKTPSFNVNPTLGFYMCFGCGESGDVITFVRNTEHLSFVETVERLAARYGVQLTYEQGGAAAGRQASQRTRLVEAHRLAAQYYAEQLGGDEAAPARQFLAERGFDQRAAHDFGVGYAPKGWDHLVKHLRAKGFSQEELVLGGLASEGRRGPVDRFRGRLLWPIRDLTGDVVGFGARKLYDDDNGPKYLNTSETPIYKKSHVLYGLDLAKKEIAKRRQVVVVEGYTDVMACHLAGVPTAVATCGTAFGAEHIAVLRRLLMDQDEMRGEVIFTFDGDSAGQKAALKAFGDEQRFVAQTFIAVSPDDMDPCDLRLARGDAAVSDLVASRTPLVEFAIRSVLAGYDLETVEGRVQALAQAAPLVGRLKDHALRPEYARRLAGWLGMEVEPVLARVAELAGDRRPPAQRRAPAPAADAAVVTAERELVKLAVQAPVLVAPEYDALDAEVFLHPQARVVHELVQKAGGVAATPGGEAWVATLIEHAPDDAARAAVTRLAVEAPLCDGEPDGRYAGAVLARVQELAAGRRTAQLKQRLQRLNPLEQVEEYNRLFAELVQLEATVRALRERGIGAL